MNIIEVWWPLMLAAFIAVLVFIALIRHPFDVRPADTSPESTEPPTQS